MGVGGDGGGGEQVVDEHRYFTRYFVIACVK